MTNYNTDLTFRHLIAGLCMVEQHLDSGPAILADPAYADLFTAVKHALNVFDERMDVVRESGMQALAGPEYASWRDALLSVLDPEGIDVVH